MRNRIWTTAFALMAFSTALAALTAERNVIAEAVISPAHAQEIDWANVDETLGRKAAVSGDVHRYGFPRSDLSVTLDGVAIKTGFALGGWVAFKPMHGEAMVMGDLVLLESEINPVMLKMIEGGARHHRRAQSLAARQPSHLLHAHRRPWRPGPHGRGDP